MDDYCKGIVEPPGDYAPHGERRFVIYETSPEPSNTSAPMVFGGILAVTESELRNRVESGYMLGYILNDDAWEKALNCLLHGEGEKEEEPMSSKRHDFFKKRLKELGLYDKNSDYDGLIGQWVEELSSVFAQQGHSGMSAQITMGVFNQLMAEYTGETTVPDSQDQPSPTPSRKEWALWIKRKPMAHEYTSYEAWTEGIGSWILSMPCVPKE